MKRIELTTPWVENWKPGRIEEIADRGCKGLVLRGGPSGTRTFYTWRDERDPAGKVKRKRVRLGAWPALSLGDARKAVHDAREARKSEATPLDRTVAQIAEAYRRDVLSHRERGDEAWNILRVHIVEAEPEPRRPPFGQWLARAVRPHEVAQVVRHAATPRVVEGRRLGGPGVARVVLRELKSIFGHGVETGSLEMTPAGVLKARSFGLRAVSRVRFLDAEEIKAFFTALDLTAMLEGTDKPQRLSPAARLGLAFQLYVPLRSHSIIGARWEEIDTKAKVWTVPVARLKLRKEERAVARPFVVPLPPTALAILDRLRREAKGSPWVLASPVVDDDEKAQPRHLEAKALIRALNRLLESDRLKLGSKVTVHDLRRTWRTLAQEAGVPDAVAERAMGHATALRAAGFSAAADVYGRAQMVEQRAQAAEVVAAMLDRIRIGTAAEVVPMAEKRRIGRGKR